MAVLTIQQVQLAHWLLAPGLRLSLAAYRRVSMVTNE